MDQEEHAVNLPTSSHRAFTCGGFKKVSSRSGTSNRRTVSNGLTKMYPLSGRLRESRGAPSEDLVRFAGRGFSPVRAAQHSACHRSIVQP